MTRTLVLIAFSGFILAVACIAGAIALGGNVLLHHHWGGRHWTVNWEDHARWRDDDHHDAGGAATSREIAWPGGDRIEFDVPADVQYTQAAGPAKLVISGPKDQVDRVELSGGDLRSRDDMAFSAAEAVVLLSRGDWPTEKIVNPAVRERFRWE